MTVKHSQHEHGLRKMLANYESRKHHGPSKARQGKGFPTKQMLEIWYKHGADAFKAIKVTLMTYYGRPITLLEKN